MYERKFAFPLVVFLFTCGIFALIFTVFAGIFFLKGFPNQVMFIDNSLICRLGRVLLCFMIFCTPLFMILSFQNGINR